MRCTLPVLMPHTNPTHRAYCSPLHLSLFERLIQ